MPNSVLNQLKALRDGVAQDLRKDPRYLTLQALDKSIEEVTAVLSASGLLPASAAPSLTQRLSGMAPQADRYAEPMAALAASEPAAAAPDSAPARTSLGFKDGTAGSPPPAVPHSLFAPSSTAALEVAGAAAVAAAMAGIAGHVAAHGPETAAAAETEAPREVAAPGDHVASHETEEPDFAAVAEPEDDYSAHDLSAHGQAARTGAAWPDETGATAPDALPREAGLASHADTSMDGAPTAAGLMAEHRDLAPLAIDSAGTDVPAEAMSALAAALFQDEAAHEASHHDEWPQEPAVTQDTVEGGHAQSVDAGDHEAAPIMEAASPQDRLTADLEAALEEMAAASPRAKTAPGSGELASDPLRHDATLADMSVPAGPADASGEPAHPALSPDELAGGQHFSPDEDVSPTLGETVAGGAGLEDAVLEATAGHEAAGDHEPIEDQDPAGETDHVAAHHEPEAAADGTAFDMIAADAIAAALFAEDAPAAIEPDEPEAGPSPQAAGPAMADVEEEPASAQHARAHEAGAPDFGTRATTIGEDAVAAALFAGDVPAGDVPAGEIPPALADGPALDEIENAIAAALFADEPAGKESAAARAGIIPEGKSAGYIVMAPKPGAAQYSPSIAVKFGKLPARVDLRPLLSPVEDQGEAQTSVAHAVAAAYEYWIQKATKKPQHISRSFIHYNARWRAGAAESDTGTAIQLALEGLQRFGACPETAWPSHPGLLNQRPGAGAYRDAASYRVHDMAQVPLKVESWKQALAEGKPVIFGLVVFDTFAACAATGGVVAMPAPEDVPQSAHAVLALCATGYNDAEKVFIVRNAWGEGFGDKGYCYIPYDYLMNPKFNDGDAWIFVPKVPSQPPRETWSETQEPVVNGGEGVDFVIPSYPASEYATVTEDFFEAIRQPWLAAAPDDYTACAGKVAKNLFDDLPPFDVPSFVAAHPRSGDDTAADVEAPAGRVETEADAWGNAASWGVSTAIDHARSAPREETGATADAELTQ